MRVIPVCAATGEAAGLGAALAARDGRPLAAMDVSRIAGELRARGAIIDPAMVASGK
jgi:hypothetical protein